MSRIIITGGSSYLGQSLVPLAGTHHQVCYTTFRHQELAFDRRIEQHQIDLRQPDAIRQLAQEWRPDAIIHLAGSNRGQAMAPTIIRGAAAVTAAAESVTARLVHMSTDVLFDGLNAPYDEEATPSPITEYGRAKAEAESIVGQYANHVIIRTSLIYDPHRLDHSTRWVRRSLGRGEPVTLFTNQYRNPIWAHSLSQACLELISMPFRGILHVAGEQVMTRAEFGLKLCRWWGVNGWEGIDLAPDELGRWPADTTLSIARAKGLLQTALPGVDDVLSRFTPSAETGP